MKVVALSTTDTTGGAGKAAYRLCDGLRGINVETLMHVAIKTCESPFVNGPSKLASQVTRVMKAKIDSLALKGYSRRVPSDWTPGWFSQGNITSKFEIKPDIVHLHWVLDGFLSIRQISELDMPLVWTLHDMWAFTGGCHYAGTCLKYTDRCGGCPQLESSKEKDLSRRLWSRKARAWQGSNMTIVTPSRWLADCTRKSLLFKDKRVEVIPNGIDTDIYKPMDKSFCRDLLGLPREGSLVLFGAMNAASDPRKGFAILQDALNKLTGDAVSELVVFGSAAPGNPTSLSVPVRYLGKVHDEVTMAAVYSAADVVVVPSMEDNLPNVVMESLACGTPCVAFDVGGIPDMIDHQRDGYLVRPYDPEDLLQGIEWVLEDKERHKVLSENAREKVKDNFDIAKVSLRYLSLYQEVLAS